MDIVTRIQAKINAFLEPDNPLGKLFTLAETHAKVPKAYIFLGVSALLAVYLIFGPGASLLAMLIGFVYPAYRSVFAIESEEKDDDTQWLTYWVVYGFFGFVEFFTDIFMSWVPFYYLLKCGFLAWCMAPGANNGSIIIYKYIIFPWVTKYSKQIDQVLDKSKEALGDMASEVSERVTSAAGQTLASATQAMAKGEGINTQTLSKEFVQNATADLEGDSKKDQ